MRISDWSSDVCSSDLARRHRPVADHRDRAAGLVLQPVRDRKAERGADRGRRMRRPERVVLALAALGEARQAAALAQCAAAVAHPGRSLVRISWVPHIHPTLFSRRSTTIKETTGLPPSTTPPPPAPPH